jgi:hypothetical protein
MITTGLPFTLSTLNRQRSSQVLENILSIFGDSLLEDRLLSILTGMIL